MVCLCHQIFIRIRTQPVPAGKTLRLQKTVIVENRDPADVGVGVVHPLDNPGHLGGEVVAIRLRKQQQVAAVVA